MRGYVVKGQRLSTLLSALGLSACANSAPLSSTATHEGIEVDPAEFIAPQDCAQGYAELYVATLVDLTDPDAAPRSSVATSCLSSVIFEQLPYPNAAGDPVHQFRADISLYTRAEDHRPDAGIDKPSWLGSCGLGNAEERSQRVRFDLSVSPDAGLWNEDAGALNQDGGDSLVDASDGTGGARADAGGDAASTRGDASRDAGSIRTNAGGSTRADAGVAPRLDAGPALAPTRAPSDAGSGRNPTDVESTQDAGANPPKSDPDAPYGGAATPIRSQIVSLRGCLLTAAN